MCEREKKKGWGEKEGEDGEVGPRGWRRVLEVRVQTDSECGKGMKAE